MACKTPIPVIQKVLEAGGRKLMEQQSQLHLEGENVRDKTVQLDVMAVIENAVAVTYGLFTLCDKEILTCQSLMNMHSNSVQCTLGVVISFAIYVFLLFFLNV